MALASKPLVSLKCACLASSHLKVWDGNVLYLAHAPAMMFLILLGLLACPQLMQTIAHPYATATTGDGLTRNPAPNHPVPNPAQNNQVLRRQKPMSGAKFIFGNFFGARNLSFSTPHGAKTLCQRQIRRQTKENASSFCQANIGPPGSRVAT